MAACPLDLGGDDRFEVDVVQQLLGLTTPGQLDHVVNESGDFVYLLDQVALQLGAVALGEPVLASQQQLQVGFEAGQRRAQLVRGVGDHLALRVGGALQGIEGGVVGAGEPAELVVGAVVMQAPGEVGAARDRLRLVGEAPHRRQRGARDERTEHRREGDTTGRDDDEDQEQLAQDAVDFVKWPGDLHGAAAVKGLGEHA